MISVTARKEFWDQRHKVVASGSRCANWRDINFSKFFDVSLPKATMETVESLDGRDANQAIGLALKAILNQVLGERTGGKAGYGIDRLIQHGRYLMTREDEATNDLS
jgi:hypothetical protein